MTGQEIVTDVRNELLEPVAGFWSDAELLNWINRAEQDFSSRVRGFEDSATLSVVAGQNTYPLPANWLSAVVIFYNNVVGGVDSWEPLSPTDLQEMSAMNPNFLSAQNALTTDYPSRYFIWNRSLYLYKTPGTTSSNSLTMFYKAKPVALTSLSSSINTDDTLAGAVRAYVLWKAWTKEKELSLAEEQKAMYYSFVRDGLRDIKLRTLNKINNMDVRSNNPISQATSIRRQQNPPPYWSTY